MANTKKSPSKVPAKTKKTVAVTAKAKVKPAKAKLPSAFQLALLRDLLSVANAKHWSLPMFLGELRKLGVHKMETCIYSAKSWFFWDDGTIFEHDDDRFKPYRVAAKADKPKVAILLTYAQKEGMDYLQLFTFMADAGVHKFIADLKTGKVGFYRVDDAGTNKLAGAFKFQSKLESLRHPHYEDLMLTFRKSMVENWPHSALYGAIADLGLDAFVSDFGPKVTTLLWSDGTKDFYDEAGSVAPSIKVAPKLDKKKLTALVKDFKANQVEYPEFISRLLKAGVQKYTTSLVAKKIIYQGKDLKSKVEEKITLE